MLNRNSNIIGSLRGKIGGILTPTTTTTLGPTTTTTAGPTTTTTSTTSTTSTTTTTLAPTTTTTSTTSTTTTIAGFTAQYLIVGGGNQGVANDWIGGNGGSVVSGSTTLANATTYNVFVGRGQTSTLPVSSSIFNSITATGGGANGNSAGTNNGTSYGGGAGAGGNGNNATTLAGGAGGVGLIWLDGNYYGAGGGGGAESIASPSFNLGGAGGNGGGGTGGGYYQNEGTVGTANTGGGGGGRRYGTSANQGKAGGSGIVIVRYTGTPNATGGTITQSGGYTYHTFTTTGASTLVTN